MFEQMGWNIWQQNEKIILDSTALIKQTFQLVTTTLLSLLLPLSFLLVARLTTARYLLDYDSYSTSQPFYFLLSFFLYTNPILLHGLVCIVCVLSLVHGLSNAWITPPNVPLKLTPCPRLYTVSILLCTLQVLVGLGMEGSIESGTAGFSFGYERSLLIKLLFFIGLHETMLCWSRTVVKPVVNDTVFDSTRKECWVERTIMAASFSTLWWWRLKDEVESLVILAEVKKELLIDVSLADCVSWWLYYLTVTTGIVRLIKSLLWAGFLLFSSEVKTNADDFCGNEEKA